MGGLRLLLLSGANFEIDSTAPTEVMPGAKYVVGSLGRDSPTPTGSSENTISWNMVLSASTPAASKVMNPQAARPASSNLHTRFISSIMRSGGWKTCVQPTTRALSIAPVAPSRPYRIASAKAQPNLITDQRPDITGPFWHILHLM